MRVGAWVLAGGVCALAGVGCSGASGGSSSSSSSGGGSSSSSSSSGGGACSPAAACTAVDKGCMAAVENQGQNAFGLRMSYVKLTKPEAFSSGLLASVIGDAAAVGWNACNLDGSGLLSWLLQFDSAAGTLKSGGARPVADFNNGYAFENGPVTTLTQPIQVEPVTYNDVHPSGSGAFSTAAAPTFNLPVYFQADGSSVLLLPIKQAKFTMATLSSNHNCIGSYNAAGLDPLNSCAPDDMTPQFLQGGVVDGFITLEEADTIAVPLLNQTLCVLISTNAAMYGEPGAGGTTVCKRDGGNKILFAGDWCEATNQAAAGGCSDAAKLTVEFAASSVRINN